VVCASVRVPVVELPEVVEPVTLNVVVQLAPSHTVTCPVVVTLTVAEPPGTEEVPETVVLSALTPV